MTGSTHSTSASEARAARPPFPLAAAAFVSNFDRFAVTPMLVLAGLLALLGIAIAAAAATGALASWLLRR